MKDCEIVSPFNFTFVKVLFMVRITKKMHLTFQTLLNYRAKVQLIMH